MLQQILRDMWVDPEILQELDETQKQTLFCKMREEQVRRWQMWDQKLGKEEAEPKRKQANGKKQVQFLQGEDGEPWVWVMGEHKDDKSVEAILAEEARQRALAQAREEAHALRKSVEKELTQLIDYKPLDSLEQKFDLSPKSIESLDENMDMYCTVEELRTRIAALEPALDKPNETQAFCDIQTVIDLNKNKLHFNFIEGKRDVLQDLGIPNGGDGVSHRVAAWERRVAAARAGDILRGLKARRARTLRDAQLHAQEDEAAWREQERKAKEAEAAMREIARAAREAHRRTADLDATGPAPAQAGKPADKAAVVEWYRSQEVKRGACVHENKPVEWFHGLITRAEAEQLLQSKPEGTFLVRLSERVWGYAVSYRGDGLCKHYLVEATAGYRLLPGTGMRVHSSLAELINYHKSVPITETGGEILKMACVPLRPPVV